jgi:hypothetical protein
VRVRFDRSENNIPNSRVSLCSTFLRYESFGYDIQGKLGLFSSFSLLLLFWRANNERVRLVEKGADRKEIISLALSNENFNVM